MREGKKERVLELEKIGDWRSGIHYRCGSAALRGSGRQDFSRQ